MSRRHSDRMKLYDDILHHRFVRWAGDRDCGRPAQNRLPGLAARIDGWPTSFQLQTLKG
jgi:hypothetical protein